MAKRGQYSRITIALRIQNRPSAETEHAGIDRAPFVIAGVTLALSARITLRARKETSADFTGRRAGEVLAPGPFSAAAVGYHRRADPQTGATLALEELLDDYSAAAFRPAAKVLLSARC